MTEAQARLERKIASLACLEEWEGFVTAFRARGGEIEGWILRALQERRAAILAGERPT